MLEEIYRFDNRQLRRDGHDCWDMDNLWDGIVGGLKACKTAGKLPATVGIDTWAVDYVLLDKDDNVLGDAVAYRDSRTEGMDALVETEIPPDELYDKTGIQKQIFNTIYQLAAQKREHPEQLEQAQSFLMLPDYFHFLLTGVRRQEYTNATSTNLVNAREKVWIWASSPDWGCLQSCLENCPCRGLWWGSSRGQFRRRLASTPRLSSPPPTTPALRSSCPVVFPSGIGVVPWMVPGGRDIAVATSERMKQYDAAIWAHHGMFCSGEDFDLTFGLMHTVEKSAEILVKVYSVTGGTKRQTIQPDEFRHLAVDFGVTLPEKFLFEK